MRISKFRLNASRSEHMDMAVRHKRKPNRAGVTLPDLVLNNEVIKRVEKTKYLESTLSKG